MQYFAYIKVNPGITFRDFLQEEPEIINGVLYLNSYIAERDNRDRNLQNKLTKTK